MPGSWEAFYHSDVQGLWALIALPALFGIWLAMSPIVSTAGAEPRAARFVRGWALVFAVEAVLDPLVTGPGFRVLGLAESEIAPIPFVLLGDFRVFVLMVVLIDPARGLGSALGEAAAWTFLVPAIAWTVTTGLGAVHGAAPATTIWIVYETAFVLLALALREVVVPRRLASSAAPRTYLRAVLAYVALYYALWAAADVLILRGRDVGWALRTVANQLYYALWVPFAYTLFFSRRYASTSTSTQAAR